MSLRVSLRICLRLTLLACWCLPVRADDQELKNSLERLYTEWRSSLLARSLPAWQSCTTTYRQVLTHNLIVSQKLRYPDAVFDLPVVPPDVRKFKLIEVEGVGPTAHLIYFGKIDLGIGTGDVKEIPDNLLVLKFFKEAAGWRFDSTKFINLAANPEMREACLRGNPEFVKHPPFNPPGVLPPVPKACREPERVAALRVQAIGYSVLATVNGFDGTPIVDTAEQQIIIGGLNLGDNSLKMKVKELPVPEGEERYLEIEAVLLPPKETDPPVRVFDWQPQQTPVPPDLALTISLNNFTLKGLKKREEIEAGK